MVTQDPLWFDYEKIYLNGGIKHYVNRIKQKDVDVPINKRAYVLYHMAKQGLHDPQFFIMMERGMFLQDNETNDLNETRKSYVVKSKIRSKELGEDFLSARYAFAGLFAYYKTHCGTEFGRQYYELRLKQRKQHLHVQEVIELLEAFNENRTLQRQHFRDFMDEHLVEILLAKWHEEAEYHQRNVFRLVEGMRTLNYSHEKLDARIIETIMNKKRINNLHFFQSFLRKMRTLNEDPSSPFFQQLDEKLAKYKEKHYTVNRKWRFDWDRMENRSLQELIDRREEAKQDDYVFGRGKTDNKMLQNVVEQENKAKRLRMAKYSEDLFDEIVEELMKQKRTVMEMMAELDVEDELIIESQ
jgi:hypothetical protein